MQTNCVVAKATLIAALSFSVFAGGCAPVGDESDEASTEEASTGTTFSSPPLQSDGLAVKYFNWDGYSWSNDSGQPWNTQVPYAIGVAPSKIRFEIHDTTNDRGQIDESYKRRAEVSSKLQFVNNTTYWHAFSFTAHWDCPTCQASLDGGTIMQMHWPSGASPAFSFRIGPKGTFRITTRGDNQGNTTRYNGPFTFDVVHDVVYKFKLNGTSGELVVWLDGKQVLNLQGVPVGSSVENGYSFRVGPYYGSGLNKNRVVQVYGNLAAFPSTADLSARISAPPAW